MHNYERKTAQFMPAIEAAINKHFKRPGGTMYVHVWHDSWCDHNKGGRCNCDPDLNLECIPKEKHQ